ncbi:hypothetical protein ACJX0J_029676 [Zea mays]
MCMLNLHILNIIDIKIDMNFEEWHLRTNLPVFFPLASFFYSIAFPLVYNNTTIHGDILELENASIVQCPIWVLTAHAFHKVVRSWASKKFMTGCVILFPIAITFYITWWFIHFVDGFFSPIYAQLGINIFGLGFVTSVTFIFLIGVFMSSWLGASVLSLGEWIIKRMPLVRHIYNASKQISAAISPDQNKQAFKEVVIIRHPRVGEYAFGFITSSVSLQSYSGQEDLYCASVNSYSAISAHPLFTFGAAVLIFRYLGYMSTRLNINTSLFTGPKTKYMDVIFFHFASFEFGSKQPICIENKYTF